VTTPVVRQAAAADLEQIVALQDDRNGAECGPMVRALWADEAVGPDHFTVADVDGRIVSSLCLMAETLELEGVSIPTGQVEFVATTKDHEHQGLVLVHRRDQLLLPSLRIRVRHPFPTRAARRPQRRVPDARRLGGPPGHAG
jgi:hypothetical protein